MTTTPFIERLRPESQTAIACRFFKNVKTASKFELSVQASELAYCSPRETLTDLSGYDTWEVAVVRPGVGVVSPARVSPEFAARFGGLFDEGVVRVAGYVPTETVQSMLDYLDTLSAT